MALGGLVSSVIGRFATMENRQVYKSTTYGAFTLVSTNDFKNETDLRLQLYNSPANPGFIAFCYIIESHSVSNLVRLR